MKSVNTEMAYPISWLLGAFAWFWTGAFLIGLDTCLTGNALLLIGNRWTLLIGNFIFGATDCLFGTWPRVFTFRKSFCILTGAGAWILDLGLRIGAGARLSFIFKNEALFFMLLMDLMVGVPKTETVPSRLPFPSWERCSAREVALFMRISGSRISSEIISLSSLFSM